MDGKVTAPWPHGGNPSEVPSGPCFSQADPGGRDSKGPTPSKPFSLTRSITKFLTMFYQVSGGRPPFFGGSPRPTHSKPGIGPQPRDAGAILEVSTSSFWSLPQFAHKTMGQVVATVSFGFFLVNYLSRRRPNLGTICQCSFV